MSKVVRRCRQNCFSDALPFGRLWYGEANAISNAIGYAKHRSRSHDAVIRLYDDAGDVIETHEHAGDFKDSFSSGFLTVLQKTSPATQQPMGLENRFDCHSSLQQKLIAMSRTPTLVRKMLLHSDSHLDSYFVSTHKPRQLK